MCIWIVVGFIFFTIWYLRYWTLRWPLSTQRSTPHTYCPRALKSGKVSINTVTITLSLKNHREILMHFTVRSKNLSYLKRINLHIQKGWSLYIIIWCSLATINIETFLLNISNDPLLKGLYMYIVWFLKQHEL